MTAAAQDMWMASCIHKGRTLNQQGLLWWCCAASGAKAYPRTVVPAEQVLAMVTVNGAKALLWEEDIGSLQAGKKADLVVVNPNTPNMLVWGVRERDRSATTDHYSFVGMMRIAATTHGRLQPLHDAVANMVSSMQARNVESVMVDGRWVLREGRVLTVDEPDVLRRARAAADGIRKRAGIVLPSRFPLAKQPAAATV